MLPYPYVPEYRISITILLFDHKILWPFKIIKMKKLYALCVFIFASVQFSFAQTTIKVMDTVLFFDGYASTVSTPAPPPGVIRHRNDLYARKLTTAELQSIGSTLHMKVTIKAACDNYDRIGNVNMALVPKGASSYNPDSVQRIEIARFITPFMNKNVQPTSVPYDYDIHNVAQLLKETSITTNYDIWMELQVFGVPYAANTQVAGCSGRNDVFYGSLELTTNAAVAAQSTNVLMPLSFQKDFNNYNANATDTVGKTTRTIQINVTSNLSDAALFLITSNHGANSGGEEYNRRNHYVYFDNVLKMTYKPGRTSCEPFRQYNTQSNGIYGTNTKTDAQWQSFSNWCPGDVIDIRRINLGALSAGNHSFKISVPDAVFNGAQGNIPLSLYLQGKTAGSMSIEEGTIAGTGVKLFPNPAADQITISTADNDRILELSLVNNLGAVVYQDAQAFTGKRSVSLAPFASGLYILRIRTGSGNFTQKVQIAH